MIYAGADGFTKLEMTNVFAKGQTPEDFEQYVHDLTDKIAKNKTRSCVLEKANRLYIQQGLRLKSAFVTALEKYYTGQMKLVDFRANPDVIAQEAKHWVSQVTHEMITSVIEASEISANSKLMLLNAAYFKGAWKKKFDKDWTIPRSFYASRYRLIKTPTMATFGYFPLFENDEVRVLAMPYEGNENINMYIILPQKFHGLEDLERSLNGLKMIHYFQNCKTSTEFYVSY
ncbi:unnamed protein product [Gongylonema pulchrum]|uniref:SERPIN domain-containing protein n=1 Tax=Gongylonema pulchrum TaxID=637853 RepID=A0A183CWV9_9BILA|nr:unnamed protein product [Gongylonema pulchrum]